MSDIPLQPVPSIQPVQTHSSLFNIPSCEIRVSFNWCSPVSCLFDCGAQANVMSYEYYLAMQNRPSVALEEKFVEQLNAVNGDPLDVVGVLRVPVRVAGTALKPDVRLFVVKGLPSTCTAILGLEFIREHIHAVYWQSMTYSLKLSPNVQHSLVVRSHSFNSQNQITLAPSIGSAASSSSSNNDATSTAPVMLVRSVTVRPRSSCLVNGTVPAGHSVRRQSENSETFTCSNLVWRRNQIGNMLWPCPQWFHLIRRCSPSC
jgi:hypothetical protein